MLEKMKINRLIILALALGSAVVSSCKKDKDPKTTYSDYMTGTLATNEIPSYLGREETVAITLSGITEPDAVGYYWYSSWDSTKDTTRVEGGTGTGAFSVKVPRDLGEYTVSCVAFAEGYYTKSATVTFTVVDPEIGKTVTGSEVTQNGKRYTDIRDGKLYYITSSGNPVWFKSNLAYTGSGIPFQKSPVMDDIFGRFYTWEEAKTACPEGWRLPTDEDFLSLASSLAGEDASFKVHEDFDGVAGGMMVNASFLGERMWEYWPSVKITNSSGFCALPIGYCIDLSGSSRFIGMNKYAAFWTADEDGENGFYRYLYVDKNDVYCGKGNKESFRASVRCVQDK
jgi:Fibrobacter succinogenes major domain (Fib_succ_major).